MTPMGRIMYATFIAVVVLTLVVSLASGNDTARDHCLSTAQTNQEKQSCINMAANDNDKTMQNYLNPRLLQDPDIMQDIAWSLQEGQVVVIRDAFLPEFANAIYNELDQTTAWELQEGYLHDGFHYHHHNVYNKKNYSPLIKEACRAFGHDDTKQFMADLTNRDTWGETECSMSYYMPGDYSLPHNDQTAARSVAFVWHLTKNWQPEWGGALYWNAEHSEHATLSPSFNTLVLFSVSNDSSHFVTKVHREATEKRLAVNGWWNSEWIPILQNVDEIFDFLPEILTHQQYEEMQDIVYNFQEYEKYDIDTQRQESMEALFEEIEEEYLRGEPEEVHLIDTELL